MKPEKIREMSEDEALHKLKSLRLDLLKERFASTTGEQKNPLKKRGIRKDIARILTIVREKQNAGKK